MMVNKNIFIFSRTSKFHPFNFLTLLHGDVGLLDLGLVEAGLAGGLLLGEEVLPVLGEGLHLGDDDVGGADADVDGLAAGLLPLDPLDVDDVLLPVDLDDLAGLLALELAADDLDLVVLDQGHGADVVLGPELFGESGGHDLAPEVGGRIEVGLSRPAGLAGDGGVLLGHGGVDVFLTGEKNFCKFDLRL